MVAKSKLDPKIAESIIRELKAVGDDPKKRTEVVRWLSGRHGLTGRQIREHATRLGVWTRQPQEKLLTDEHKAIIDEVLDRPERKYGDLAATIAEHSLPYHPAMTYASRRRRATGAPSVKADRLDPKTVRQIKIDLDGGTPPGELAAKHGVSPSTISQISSGYSYAGVSGPTVPKEHRQIIDGLLAKPGVRGMVDIDAAIREHGMAPAARHYATRRMRESPRLTDAAVRDIRRRIDEGEPHHSISRDYDLPHHLVEAVASREYYGRVPSERPDIDPEKFGHETAFSSPALSADQVEEVRAAIRRVSSGSLKNDGRMYSLAEEWGVHPSTVYAAAREDYPVIKQTWDESPTPRITEKEADARFPKFLARVPPNQRTHHWDHAVRQALTTGLANPTGAEAAGFSESRPGSWERLPETTYRVTMDGRNVHPSPKGEAMVAPPSQITRVVDESMKDHLVSQAESAGVGDHIKVHEVTHMGNSHGLNAGNHWQLAVPPESEGKGTARSVPAPIRAISFRRIR